MSEWVSKTETSRIYKVGLSSHYKAVFAKKGRITAKRAGKKKWIVEVLFTDGKYELVWIDESEQNPYQQIEIFLSLLMP